MFIEQEPLTGRPFSFYEISYLHRKHDRKNVSFDNEALAVGFLKGSAFSKQNISPPLRK